MAYVARDAGVPTVEACQYGTSKLLFRGPARPLDGRYVVALGGTETCGKFIATPYSDHLEQALHLPVVNLGIVNAGVDVYLNERGLQPVLQGAAATVVQIMGAHNLTNRFYRVHPRRNDRFISATPALRALFPEVDFTEFSFTRHLLQGLRKQSASRFEQVVEELRGLWVERMGRLLKAVPRPVLLWMADVPPPRAGGMAEMGRAPLFVDLAMISALRPQAAAYVELPRMSGEAVAGGGFNHPGFLGLPDAEDHQRIAGRLAPVLRS